MKYGSLILEKKEYVYLKRLLNISGYAKDQVVQKSLIKLSNELKTAHIVDNDQMPEDVIRFGSVVNIEFENGLKKTIQLVIPIEKSSREHKISVLTPMGSALIGYSKGDRLEWDFPGGNHVIKIADVSREKSVKGIDLVI
ncbi:GreA/GreB family elongation factor [Psychroserpens damuponensis]|uniref:GreA/GreB family elongation factor n=1 Tax=Psychroserpens damuponensis TaxID=943936 RepID=UPI00058F4A9D|nr:GreA/GreB family elongation factor [Psychroserpens damuponensis]